MSGLNEEEQEASARSLEEGGLPLAATRRLKELAAAPGSLFTSDLSVSEFALLHRQGVVPITQVMGSSIFQHGWQTLPRDTWWAYRRGAQGGMFAGGLRAGGGNWGSGGDGRAWTRELTYLSDAFNGARTRALDRMRAEAELAGADAVVGVRISDGVHAFTGGDTIEFTAVGTAVRLPAELRHHSVTVTDLSAQEYVQLAHFGCRPVGVVGVTTVMYVASGVRDSWVLSSGNSIFSVAGRANQELRDFTKGFYEAREVAIGHLSRQAAALGAHGMVGIKFAQSIREREYEDGNENTHHDLVIYVHLLGTAITEGHAPVASTPPRTVISLARSRGAG